MARRIFSFFRKDRRLGIAEGRRRYDLPLNKDSGSGFLRLLIGLMSFLAIMALTFSFALGGLAERWSSGLENKLTVEVPAQSQDDKMLQQSEIEAIQTKIAEALEKNPNIKSVDVLSADEIQELIKPWFGEDLNLSDISLPGLVSVELHLSSDDALAKIRADMKAINSIIQVDAHESWLNEVLRFATSLQIAAIVIAGVIILTTITAVAGAVRSRIAIHRADVELLHLMGASDLYITRQFQRHALVLALQGSMAGTIFSLALVLLMGLFISTQEQAMTPNLNLQAQHFAMIILFPAVACMISALTARFTVLRALSMMP